MTRVLRLQEELQHTLEGWGKSAQYDKDAIGKIADSNGEDKKVKITSIPSPFAQIDLVKTAFEKVKDNIDGDSIFHKLVSDALDVGQIFFEIDNLKDSFEIITWDIDNDLQSLLDSDNPSHKQLGKSLDLFLRQDASTYHFDRISRIYLLNYIGKGKPTSLNIIGATSPATLFFASSNNLRYVSEHIRFGQDKPFDDEFAPLYKRDIEYFKYLWALFKDDNLRGLFGDIDGYLEKNYQRLDDTKKKILDKASISNYRPITIGPNNGVEVLGYTLYKRAEVGEFQSDFEIKPSIPNPARPLVLPQEGNRCEKWKYVSDVWGKDNKAPEKDDNPNWKERKLPCESIKYPYLTLGDFLEDTIVQMPYKLNGDKYYDGNLHYDTKDDVSFLLPLKPLFFQFFTVDDLMDDEKGMLKMTYFNNGVTVELKIPTQKGVIEYHKHYAKKQLINNDGIIKESKFVFASMPNIRFNEDDDAMYRFVIYSEKTKYGLEFFNGTKQLKFDGPIERNPDNENYLKDKNYVLDKTNYTHIQMNVDGVSGMIVPKLKKQSGSDQFSFAIDFGTTNTHIAYSVNGGEPKPFDITEDDMQVSFLDDDNGCTPDFRNAFLTNFFPQMLGGDKECHFPLRTVLTSAKNVNWNLGVLPLAHANASFSYEKLREHAYNKSFSELKWTIDDSNNEAKVSAFINSLFFLLRNKVLINFGDLKSTNVVWFYPVSMTKKRIELFESVWEKAFRSNFGDLGNLSKLTESIAPYEAKKEKEFGSGNVLTIDIGGGTTDVVMASNKKIDCITSFRFAANSIFGDTYGASEINGIVGAYKDEIKQVLTDANASELLAVLQKLEENKKSTDLASFLFSLCDNRKLKEAKASENVDFNKILRRDEYFKIVFLLFYSSIIYHIANLMKCKKLGMPRCIAFSGNGSKVIPILTTNDKSLSKFTQLIFEKVYGKPYDQDDLTIEMPGNNPKEMTCIGGLVKDFGGVENDEDLKDLKKIVVMNPNGVIIDGMKYGTIKDDEVASEVKKDIENFVRFFFELDGGNVQKSGIQIKFKDLFGINQASKELAKQICLKDLVLFTKNGLNAKRKEVENDDEIEETMFFYPLSGILNRLANEINHQMKTQN